MAGSTRTVTPDVALFAAKSVAVTVTCVSTACWTSGTSMRPLYSPASRVSATGEPKLPRRAKTSFTPVPASATVALTSIVPPSDSRMTWLANGRLMVMEGPAESCRTGTSSVAVVACSGMLSLAVTVTLTVLPPGVVTGMGSSSSVGCPAGAAALVITGSVTPLTTALTVTSVIATSSVPSTARPRMRFG